MGKKRAYANIFIIHFPHFAAHSKCQKRWCEFVLVMVLDKEIILHVVLCFLHWLPWISWYFIPLESHYFKLEWLTCILEKNQRVYVLFIWYFPFDVYNVLFPIPIELSAFPYFTMWHTFTHIILIFISPSPLYSKLTQVSP